MARTPLVPSQLLGGLAPGTLEHIAACGAMGRQLAQQPLQDALLAAGARAVLTSLTSACPHKPSQRLSVNPKIPERLPVPRSRPLGNQTSPEASDVHQRPDSRDGMKFNRKTSADEVPMTDALRAVLQASTRRVEARAIWENGLLRQAESRAGKDAAGSSSVWPVKPGAAQSIFGQRPSCLQDELCAVGARAVLAKLRSACHHKASQSLTVNPKIAQRLPVPRWNPLGNQASPEASDVPPRPDRRERMYVNQKRSADKVSETDNLRDVLQAQADRAKAQAIWKTEQLRHAKIWAGKKAAGAKQQTSVQLKVGAREQCECDPCCSDGEEFDEACSHGTHCAACQVWQTGLWKDCCVYLMMGKLGHVHRRKAGRLSRAMEGDGDRGRGNKDRSGGKGSNHKRNPKSSPPIRGSALAIARTAIQITRVSIIIPV